MQPSKSARTTVLAITTALLIAVAIAIACAPTATSPTTAVPETTSPNLEDIQHGTAEKPFQIPQTSGLQSVNPQAPGPTATIPQPPTGPDVGPVIDHNLQRHINRYNEEKKQHERTRQTMEPVFVDIIVIVNHPDDVDKLAAFMQNHSTGHVTWSKGNETSLQAGGANGRVNIELIPTIMELPGVISIFEVIPEQPAGQLQQGTPPTTSQPIEELAVSAWHAAGINGTGIGIGIIDTDFRNFASEVTDPNSDRISFLCYDSQGATTETDFSACATPRLDSTGNPIPNPHGTGVAKALNEIAPNANLYISNATTATRVRQATDWMTAKRTDNANIHAPYAVRDNDDFNVKVINRSGTAIWDGPGDGTSPFIMPMNPSPLNTVNHAIENNAIWVNAAGNANQRTWFSRTPFFNTSNYLEFKPTGTKKHCNPTEISKNVDYVFQLRWSGQWPRANTDLNLHVFGPIGTAQTPDFVASALTGQAGGTNQYPREVIDKFKITTISSTLKTTDTYCLYVSINPLDTTPNWVQLQIFTLNTTLDNTTGTGSISNPAESNNPAMLAVGATNNDPTFTIKDFSSRGPAPEPIPEGRIKPEVVSINTDRAGTSFSAPRVAGLAALVIQALGDRGDYNEPHEIVNYIKTKAVPLPTENSSPARAVTPPQTTITTPNNDYGHGLAKLPGLDPPTNLVLTHQPCNRDAHLLLTLDPPDWDAINDDGTNVRFEGFVRLDPGIPGEVSQVEGIHTVGEDSLSFTTVRDATYYAVAQICPINGSSRMCSIQSERSNHITVPPEVCAPEHVSGVPGDGMLTVRWNHERHATGYDVQQEHGTAIEVLENQHKVFSNLTNGTTYRFRVRAKGIPGTSEWSEWMTAVPGPTAPTKVQQIGSYSNSGIYIKMYWDETPGNATYRVQQWDRTAKSWRKLPYKEKGQPEKYEIHFFYTYAGAEAKVTGLTPGKTYTYRFKSLNGSQESDWSDQVNFTAGPIRLHPDHTPTPNKSEPRDLAATVSGTNVVLNWTKGENENFATQVVRRKTHEGGPTITEFSVTLDAETYTDTTTVSGTTYIYRIANVKNPNADNISVDVISNYQYITVP